MGRVGEKEFACLDRGIWLPSVQVIVLNTGKISTGLPLRHLDFSLPRLGQVRVSTDTKFTQQLVLNSCRGFPQRLWKLATQACSSDKI